MAKVSQVNLACDRLFCKKYHNMSPWNLTNLELNAKKKNLQSCCDWSFLVLAIHAMHFSHLVCNDFIPDLVKKNNLLLIRHVPRYRWWWDMSGSCHNHWIQWPGCYLSFALQVQCCRGQKQPIEVDWIYCLLAICLIKLASAIVLSQSSQSLSRVAWLLSFLRIASSAVL